MRYHRQELVLGKKAQNTLTKLHLMVVGVGALGTVFSELATRAGVKKITLIDRDIIELSNLHRQTLFTESDVGKPKAHTAKKHLHKINRNVTITSIDNDLLETNLTTKLDKNTFFIDCTDNLETRYYLNDLSVKYNIPLIYGTALHTKGSAALLNTKKAPCLRCFLNEKQATETCTTSGVLNAVTSIIASLQWSLLLHTVQSTHVDKLVLYDHQTLSTQLFSIKKRKNCVCCIRRQFDYLEKRATSTTIKLCGKGMVQLTPKQFDHTRYTKLKQKKSTLNLESALLINNKITLFPNGRALIKAATKTQAKQMYTKHVGL